MVLEMIQVLKLQRLILAPRVVARHLLRAAQLLCMLCIKMVEHYCWSTVLERPLLMSQGFIPDTTWTLLPIHQERKKIRFKELRGLPQALHHDVGLRSLPLHSLPFTAKNDHQLSRLDAVFPIISLDSLLLLRFLSRDQPGQVSNPILVF